MGKCVDMSEAQKKLSERALGYLGLVAPAETTIRTGPEIKRRFEHSHSVGNLCALISLFAACITHKNMS